VRRSGLSALLAALLLAGALPAVWPAHAQDAPPGTPPGTPPGAPPGTPPGAEPAPVPEELRCGWCGTTGRTPVELGNKWDVELDAGEGWKVEHCSDAIAEANMGLDWEPCARCKTETLKAAAEAEYGAVAARAAAWLDEVRQIDATAGDKSQMVHVQTTHFRVSTDVGKITGSDKKSYRTHELAHLYARRFEEFYERYKAMFAIEDSNNIKNMHSLILFEKQAPGVRVAPAYTGLSLQDARTVKRSGGANHESTVVTWWDKAEFPKDQDMQRHQTHNLVHQLTSVFYDLRWFKPGEKGLSPLWLNDKYGWLDEGLAHWFEIDFDERANTYCFREQDMNSRWGGDDWKKNVYKAALAGDIPSFTEAALKPTQSLSAKEHQFVWSWVDFLMARDSAVMGKAMKMCKMEQPTRDILRECWGLSPLGLEEEWRAWVTVEYAPTNKR
jgi:hypothetical protein